MLRQFGLVEADHAARRHCRLQRLILLPSPDDPRLLPYRAIKDRDSARDGLFIAEGEVVVRHLLATRRFPVHSLLLDEARHAAMRDDLAALPDPPDIMVVSAAVMTGIAGFHVHRGCLATVQRLPPLLPEALLVTSAAPLRLVVAIGLANHDNVGAVFRNAAAFGADGVLLDEESCDPLYRKAIRVSVGAALSLPFARLPALDISGWLKANSIEPLALTPAGDEDLRSVVPPGRFALLLGAEGPAFPMPSSPNAVASAFRWRRAGTASMSRRPARSRFIT